VIKASQKRGSFQLARWILIPLAAAAALSGVSFAGAANASTQADTGSLGTVVSLANSGNSVCAVLSSGKAECWGYNGNGQLGNGTTASSDIPVAVHGITNAKAVSGDVNGQSFCALLSTGQLKCWGYNGFGELGNGTTTSFTVPVSVKKISTATAVLGGGNGFCARLSSKHLDCWGYGGSGQLGNGSFNNSDVPVAVRSISAAVTMISGSNSFCALLSTSRVNCWGSGSSGQLGDGSFNGSDVPVRVTGITTAKAVTDMGHSSVCALLSSSKVDCWGYNGDGELGNGTTASSATPVGVLGISTAKAVSGNFNGQSFCVVLSTDHLKCWGYNGFGELGNGTTTNFTVPVSVKNISTATAVFGGENGFCALLSSKHLDCWGAGGFGQLGNGSFNSSDVPVAVRSISTGVSVISGNDSFCALLSTSHVDCWGNGGSGQLGDGSFNDSDVPVPVS